MSLPKLARESWGGEILCVYEIMGVADQCPRLPLCLSLVDRAFSAPTAADGRRSQSPGDTCGRRPTLGKMNNRENRTWLRYGLSLCALQAEKLFFSQHLWWPGGLIGAFPPAVSRGQGLFFMCSVFSKVD